VLLTNLCLGTLGNGVNFAAHFEMTSTKSKSGSGDTNVKISMAHVVMMAIEKIFGNIWRTFSSSTLS
jgi:hypothetical protein